MDRKELLREVRIAINEGMNEYRALSHLAREIIALLAKRNLAHLQEYFEDPRNPPDALPMSVRYSDLKNITQDPELGGTDAAAMISSLNGFIAPQYRSANRTTLADYGSEKHEGSITLSRIRLFYTNTMLDRLKTLNYSYGNILFNFLWNAMGSSLVHELKHAVDDYRLGKHFAKADEFKQKYSNRKPSPPDFKDEDPTEWLEYHRAYLNLPHEIWARFAELVHGTAFKEEIPDQVYAYMPDGEKGILYVTTPLPTVLSRLKRMAGWEHMDQRQQRRMINALSSIWHEEQDWVKENNEKVNQAK